MKRNDNGGNSQDERWKMVRSDKMYWHWSQAYLFLSLIVNRFLFVTSKKKRSLMKWKLFLKRHFHFCGYNHSKRCKDISSLVYNHDYFITKL